MNPSTTKGALYITCIICDASRASTTRKFFRFPKDPILKSIWVEFCVSCGVMCPSDVNYLTPRIFICEFHFLKDDMGKKNLRKNAVPKIYISENMPDPGVNETGSWMYWKNEKMDILEEGLETKLSTYSSANTEEPQKAESMGRACILYVSNKEKRLKVLRDKSQRAKRKVKKLKTMLNDLQKKALFI